jgi:hypothetical protein
MATIVYVKDGKEIPGDAWVEFIDPEHGTLTGQPVNMTPSQMTLAGVTTAELQPIPDEFYGPVQKDPDNPGQWIQTPYPPEEMQIRLHDYSAMIRSKIENGGMMLSDSSHATPSTRDVRAMYTTGSHNAGKKNEMNMTAKLYPIVDGMPSSVPVFKKLSKKEIDQMDTDLMQFTESCFNIEANTSVAITAGATTTKEQIEAAYAPVMQHPLKMPPRAI